MELKLIAGRNFISNKQTPQIISSMKKMLAMGLVKQSIGGQN
jgi:hypothetical protein